jgi:hypothetical protein
LSSKRDYTKALLDARKQLLTLSLDAEKEILKVYKAAAKNLDLKILTEKSELKKRHHVELKKNIDAYIKTLQKELKNAILKSIQASSELAVYKQMSFFDYMDIEPKLIQSFKSMFSTIPKDAVKSIVSGGYYKDSLTLDERLWKITKRNGKAIENIINSGIAEQISPNELAKKVDRYINPINRMQIRTKVPGIDSKISYQATRLARTSIAHAHTEAYIRGANENPFTTGLKWNLSSEHHARLSKFGKSTDICDDYAHQNSYKLGSGVFPSDKYPISHPNCLCYPTTVTVDPDEATDEVLKWLRGEPNEKLDQYKNRLDTSGLI